MNHSYTKARCPSCKTGSMYVYSYGKNMGVKELACINCDRVIRWKKPKQK